MKCQSYTLYTHHTLMTCLLNDVVLTPPPLSLCSVPNLSRSDIHVLMISFHLNISEPMLVFSPLWCWFSACNDFIVFTPSFCSVWFFSPIFASFVPPFPLTFVRAQFSYQHTQNQYFHFSTTYAFRHLSLRIPLYIAFYINRSLSKHVSLVVAVATITLSIINTT